MIPSQAMCQTFQNEFGSQPLPHPEGERSAELCAATTSQQPCEREQHPGVRLVMSNDESIPSLLDGKPAIWPTALPVHARRGVPPASLREGTQPVCA